MTTFKTIAQKLLTSKDYKHPDQVNQDIEKLVELYEELQEDLKAWEKMADSHGKAMGFLQKEREELKKENQILKEALGKDSKK